MGEAHNRIEDKNYYQILNVNRTATTDEIRESYRDIAKIYHPDSNFYAEIINEPLGPEQIKIFKVITAAYNTLVSPEKRALYDRALPGELRGWDDPETFWDHTNSAPKTSAETAYAKAPRFGRKADAPPSAFDSSGDLSSVSDIIRRQSSLSGPIMFLILGVAAGAIAGLILLFALGYI